MTGCTVCGGGGPARPEGCAPWCAEITAQLRFDRMACAKGHMPEPGELPVFDNGYQVCSVCKDARTARKNAARRSRRRSDRSAVS